MFQVHNAGINVLCVLVQENWPILGRKWKNPMNGTLYVFNVPQNFCTLTVAHDVFCKYGKDCEWIYFELIWTNYMYIPVHVVLFTDVTSVHVRVGLVHRNMRMFINHILVQKTCFVLWCVWCYLYGQLHIVMPDIWICVVCYKDLQFDLHVDAVCYSVICSGVCRQVWLDPGTGTLWHSNSRQ